MGVDDVWAEALHQPADLPRRAGVGARRRVAPLLLEVQAGEAVHQRVEAEGRDCFGACRLRLRLTERGDGDFVPPLHELVADRFDHVLDPADDRRVGLGQHQDSHRARHRNSVETRRYTLLGSLRR